MSKIPQRNPPNILFQRHDTSLPFLEEIQGTFDLVHICLLALALKTNEWDVAILFIRMRFMMSSIPWQGVWCLAI